VNERFGRGCRGVFSELFLCLPFVLLYSHRHAVGRYSLRVEGNASQTNTGAGVGCAYAFEMTAHEHQRADESRTALSRHHYDDVRPEKEQSDEVVCRRRFAYPITEDASHRADRETTSSRPRGFMTSTMGSRGNRDCFNSTMLHSSDTQFPATNGVREGRRQDESDFRRTAVPEQ
jgi:hypothetical protein